VYILFSFSFPFPCSRSELFLSYAGNIKVVAETNEQSEVYLMAKEQLLEAEYIHFLGFGYDKENLKRLKFGFGESKAKISGTHLGLSQRRIEELSKSGGEFGMRINLRDVPKEIEYFREMVEA